ncbi:hypothetical protein DPMN_095495 [Dreissena polymorpha]|uniref:Uncharacterized protein n=1 Tax=Dreissena polymorpha TaxID=45954 RepID=A0A9D4R3L8_DREPO|nr:hypothetical protein DPMN_095495 [Dreissena polymorpha]
MAKHVNLSQIWTNKHTRIDAKPKLNDEIDLQIDDDYGTGIESDSRCIDEDDNDEYNYCDHSLKTVKYLRTL